MFDYGDVYNDLLKIASEEAGLLFRSDGDKSHDYNPNWDYNVDENPPAEAARIARDASAKIYADLVAKGVIDQAMFGFEVWAVKLENNAVGMYISGTYDFPVVLVDLNKHRGYEDQIEKTIRHELKHAVQQSEDRELDEDEAEADDE